MLLLDRLRRKPAVLMRIERERLSLLHRDCNAWRTLFTTDLGPPTHAHGGPVQAALDKAMLHLASPSNITVLCDSRWAPVSMLHTGPRPLPGTQLQALARHRFSEIHGAGAASWHYSIEYRAGDPQALAFALPDGLHTAIQRLAQADGKLHALTIVPTLGWVWNNAWRKDVAKDTWLLLNEQDRSIVMRQEGGHCTALQPSGPRLERPSEAVALIQTEAKRFGIRSEIDAVQGFSFEPLAGSNAVTNDAPLKWHTLLAEPA